MYVIATAGHVDHGKSTLVRALTGMEPDRWAEERRRGMTIDLGYAWMTLPSADGGADGDKLAFVDVPGHERFVPNMLAGLGPVPAVMFVVAADGGWMPQSAEHLAAVNALGVRHGLLVVTRADLADPGPATRQALAEIARTSLGAIEAVPVSAVTGQGLDELRSALGRLVAGLPGPSAAADQPPVRLWIDRSFTIRGAGTVVTGTLPAGTVRNGQELLLSPSLGPVRVRGLEALGEPADQVAGVARVALNLRGVPAGVPARGMALIEPGRWTLATELDVRIAPPAADPQPKFPPELLLHIGAARTQARLRILGTAGEPAPCTGDSPGAGKRGLPGGDADGIDAPTAIYARLRLRDPLPLHVGDRVLLRDPGAAGLAIYGATVLDPAPPPLARRGAGAAAVRELSAWPDVPAAADLLRRHKLVRAPQLLAAGLTDLPPAVAVDWLADPAHWAALRAGLPAVVADFCARDPLAQGMSIEAARASLKLPSRDLVTALVGADIVQDGGYLRVFTRQAADAGQAAVPETAADRSARATEGATASAAGRLPPNIAAAVQSVLDDLGREPFAAPDTERLRALGLDAKALAAAARAGLLLRVADLVVLAPGAAGQAAELLAGLDQPFTTSQARQALGTSRRVAIPLLEYLDRARITERLPGDLRRLRDLQNVYSVALSAICHWGSLMVPALFSSSRSDRERRPNRAVPAVLLAAALAAAATACSSSGSAGAAAADSTVGPATATASASASASASVSASAAGARTLTGAAATALLAKAVANTRTAGSMVVKAAELPGGIAGQATSIDLTLVQKVGCEGSIGESKTESFQLVVRGGYIWMKPSAGFYASLKFTQAEIALVGDRWIKAKSTDAQLSSFGDLCNFSSLFGTMGTPTGTSYVATPTTYEGRSAYKFIQAGQAGNAYITNSTTPTLAELDVPGKTGGSVTFDVSSTPLTITTPSAADTIDGDTLGL